MYLTVSTMQQSQSLLLRCSAAAATEVVQGSTPGDAEDVPGWVSAHSWDYAATPGWDAKWESGIAGGIPDPGGSSAVITDADILTRTQQLLTEYPLP